MSRFPLKGAELVIRHRRLPFVTYPFEWPAPGLKAAAAAFLDLNIRLARRGLGVIDAHPWNILMEGARPRFVDFGSLCDAVDGTLLMAGQELETHFLTPLKVMAAGHRKLGRALLSNIYDPISPEEASLLQAALHQSATPPGRLGREILAGVARQQAKSVAKAVLPGRVRRALRAARNGRASPAMPRDSRAELESSLSQIRESVERIAIKAGKTSWLDYYDQFPPFEARDEWTLKQTTVTRLIEDARPSTLIDLAGNTGWFSQFAARKGTACITADIDEGCLDHAFSQLSDTDLSVTPIFLNIRDPKQGYGWSGRQFTSAAERLGSDVALSLAVVHHLVYYQMADFDRIARALSDFTRSRLVVEFVSKEDQHVAKWWNPSFGWYTLENFTASLRAHFQRVEVMPSYPSGRYLVCCDTPARASD